VLLTIEQCVNRCLFRSQQRDIADRLAGHDGADKYRCCTLVGGEAKWDVGE
jgi:hypothetical protein